MASNIFSLAGKVIIITGGAGFLGTEFSRHFLSSGANVVIFDICAEEVLNEKAKTLFSETGKVPMVKRVDITDEKEVQKAVQEVVKRFGKIDVLLNNAAMNPVPASAESAAQFSPYETYPADLWKKEIDVGVTGTLFMTQAVAEHMMKNKRGSIVNISSVYGLVAPDNRIYEKGKFKSIGYATVKSALMNFTRAWASYLGEHNVRVNTIVFGGVENNQNPAFVKKYAEKTILNRMADKSDFNGTLTLLASDASTYITGSTIIIDGGWSAW